jgi:hypothetical protein
MKNRANIMFVVLLILFMWITWKLAISKTVMLRSEIKIVNEKLNTLSRVSENIEQINFQLNNARQIMALSNKNTSEIQEHILDLLNKGAPSNISLWEFSPPEVRIDSTLTIETTKIVLTGGFIPLLKTVNLLEKHREIGSIISIRFKTNVNPPHPKSLSLTLYIQNFKQSGS